jgi:CheY-like chemotaxis protein
VLCRSSGDAALRTATEEVPAAIVIDLVMPDRDGFDLVRRLRNTMAGEQMPILIWTMKELSPKEQEYPAVFAPRVVFKGKGAATLIEELRHYVPAPAPAGKASHGR